MNDFVPLGQAAGRVVAELEPPRPTYVLTITPANRVSEQITIAALKAILKTLLRRHSFRCLSIEECRA